MTIQGLTRHCDTMAAVALDDAPGLTTVNQLWWMMVEDQKNAALDHALANYYNVTFMASGLQNSLH